MKTCPNCNAQNPAEATFCMSCGYDLVALDGTPTPAPTTKLCGKCGVKMPVEALFCSKCGAKYDGGGKDGVGKTMFFGAMQEKGKAKLILIKGGGLEGVSYNLNSTDHFTGRSEGFILFPEDPFCSPKHANFFYFGGKFFVSDEKSLNGVFLRIRSPIEIKDDLVFRLGEQLFRANLVNDFPRLDSLSETDDGTKFLGSPGDDSPSLALTHILEDGRLGPVIYPAKETFTLGREGCDLNFPKDAFMSGKHARITKSGDKYFLADNGSKNGTYFRIAEEHELVHGDYVFIGQQLLRVEITQ
ncbi:MAG: FHA domain-containing protein [Myxococcales bacterium]|nr:MAG: FHA domain-containing protein [Myxococcales bacterium]